LGDFWSVRDSQSGFTLSSPQVVSFDGANFHAEAHPWLNRCEGQIKIGSRIDQAVDLGTELLAVGVFALEPPDPYGGQMLALHDGIEWSMLAQLFVSRLDSRVFHSAGTTWVAGRSIHRLEGDHFLSLGRIAGYDAERRDLIQLSESNTLGVRSSTKGAGQVQCLATHQDAVVVGGAFAAPVGRRGSLDSSPLYAIAGQTASDLSSPAFVQPTTLLSSASGLYAADENVLVRIGAGSDREVLVSDIVGFPYVMAEHDDALIVGGGFGSLDAVAAINLARLQDGAIEPFGDPDGPVRALAYFAGDLIAGGDFAQIGGVAARAIARWNGAQWAPMGEAISGTSPVGTARSGSR
jgi:hypothetical protein